jgi:hypothetical protein
VETESLLIVTEHVTQNTNDKREVEPTLKALEQLPNRWERPKPCWPTMATSATTT